MSKKFIAVATLVALTTLNTGVSFAAQRQSRNESRQPRTTRTFRPTQQRGIQPQAVPSTGLLYAVVNSSSSLVRGNGAVSTSRLIDGNIQVNFNRSVAACAYGATIGRAVAGGSVDRGFITASPISGRPNSVLVVTRDRNGVLVNTDFHLQLMCD